MSGLFPPGLRAGEILQPLRERPGAGGSHQDLASLLRRIGRPEHDRAVAVARQLCAGLAAAHARGIVHRDLKPANVMIDGRGQARITDFGLAGLAEGIEGAEVRAGTPDYMAPEQLAGREVTVRSDIYSLGLVLYELFTGKPAFQSASIAERAREDTTVVPRPSTLVGGLAPAVERVILRCLETDPARRPASALDVAAALPGGDPLAAALAAGETPSPAMVADAGAAGGLRPAAALGALATLLAGLVAVMFVYSSWVRIERVGLPLSPQEMTVRARAMAQELGWNTAFADEAGGFAVEGDYVRWVEESDRSPQRWVGLGDVRPSPVSFWYRQSPDPLVPANYEGGVDWTDPPVVRSGMVNLRLDRQGRLLDLLAVPPQLDTEPAAEPEAHALDAVWGRLFAAAGFDRDAFRPATPRWNPVVASTARAAWEGSVTAGGVEVPLRLEAGAYRGRPVFFTAVAPWTMPGRERSAASVRSRTAGPVALLVLLAVIVTGASILARRNLRLGRSDRSGAFRLAAYAFVLMLVGWAVKGHHVAALAEVGLVFQAVQFGLLAGGLTWLIYVALEPYVRKFWPQALVGWTRLLDGRWRDPLVGRDLLLGALAGVVMALLFAVIQLGPQWLGQPANVPHVGPWGFTEGWGTVLAVLCQAQPDAVFSVIALLFLILLIRVLTRRPWLAVVATVGLLTVLVVLNNPGSPVVWAAASLYQAVLVAVVIRLGLLAAVAAVVVTNVLIAAPLTVDPSAWYAPYGWALLLVPAVIAIYGAAVTTAGRAWIADPLGESSGAHA